MNTGRYEFVDCIRLALFGDGCSAAVLTAQDVKPGDNKWIIEGNQYFSNQTSITIKEARFLEILVFKNNELVNYDRFILQFSLHKTILPYRLCFTSCQKYKEIHGNLGER